MMRIGSNARAAWNRPRPRGARVGALTALLAASVTGCARAPASGDAGTRLDSGAADAGDLDSATFMDAGGDAGGDAGVDAGCSLDGERWLTGLSAEGGFSAHSIGGDDAHTFVAGTVGGDGVLVTLDRDGAVSAAVSLGPAATEPTLAALGGGDVAVALAPDAKALAVARLRSDGTTAWSQALRIEAPWLGIRDPRIAETPDGTMWVAASLDAASLDGRDGLLVLRFDPDGHLGVAREIILSHGALLSLSRRTDGGALLSVTTDQFAIRTVIGPFGGRSRIVEAWLAAFAPSGDVTWQRVLSTTVYIRHEVRDAELRADGDRLAGMIDASTGIGGFAPWVVDLDADGNVRQSAAFVFPGSGSRILAVHGDHFAGGQPDQTWWGALADGSMQAHWLSPYPYLAGHASDGSFLLVGGVDCEATPGACAPSRPDLLLERMGDGPTACQGGLAARDEAVDAIPVPLVTTPTSVAPTLANLTVEAWIPDRAPISIRDEAFCFASAACGGTLRHERP